ncbi:MAG: oligosaccharide flippase family protein [Anaerolineae bacterium]|jgi:O-antigen/teichoic acid export membrane protein
MIRRRLPTLASALILILLPLTLFAPVALGDRTLLPADVLFLFEPYRAAADELGVGIPQNPLFGDLILENYAWKQFLVEAIHNRDLPLWDPYTFAGHPFLANGQHSALYPLAVTFYLIPLWRAYGLFIWLQLGLAGCWAYLFARTLGVRRLGALIGGITFQLSGFMLVSVVHPMIVAGASWLPFILAMVERLIQQRPALGRRPSSLPWTLLGALGLGCQMLAGHAENTYFVLLVTALYAGWRLVHSSIHSSPADSAPGPSRVRPVLWLMAMVGLGLALGAVQFIPLYEVAASSFRAGEAAPTLSQVLGWAYPPRRLITFAIPNFFGNPAHHGHFDLFQGQAVRATANALGEDILSHDWGIKNYVEGGAYLGLLPLLLAVLAVFRPPNLRVPNGEGRGFVLRRIGNWFRHPYVPFFTLLSLFSLGCVFGTPLYAPVYALPFFRQSHSPFRWVFPLTLSVAMLAGFGIEVVRRSREKRTLSQPTRRSLRSRIGSLFLLNTAPTLVSIVAALAFWGGVVTLTGLVLSRVLFVEIEPLVKRAFWNLTLAPNAFADHRAFYSYEFQWIALFGLVLTGTGIVLRVSRCPISLRGRPVWEPLAVVLLVADLASFGAGFHPAVDPALLDYTPPVVEFLQEDTSLWRYAAFTPPGSTKTMNPNAGMFYDLQAVDGYDSLFPRQYADYMELIEEQDELRYNLIAPFRNWSSLDSPLTDLLNVKYVITEAEIPNPAKYRLAYQDEAVRVYENLTVMPRAFTLPISATVVADDVAEALRTHDPHRFVIVESPPSRAASNLQPAAPSPQPVTHYTINEVFVDAAIPELSWLVLTDSFFPGWRAFVRPHGSGEEAEQEITIARVDGNFRGVLLEAGEWTVRFKYSPNSVKIGSFLSFIAGMVVLFLAGFYLWRFFYREDAEPSTVQRVAKNSLAPIVTNLFNRVIDLAFAALMARILGPVGNGRYATAIAVFGWFDILTNFGLNMYLLREVARERDRAGRLLVNTTALRLTLLGVGIPLLSLFLWGRQALAEPMAADTVKAILLLYLGLLPGTVAMGLGAFFQAFERHEIPAAIQTFTTIIKVTLGVLLLVGGLGIVGLAGASIVTNLATLAILAILAHRLIFRGERALPLGLDRQLLRRMVRDSWALMLVHLLQSLFFKVDVVLLQGMQGDAVAGWYDAAYKWVNALNIIPSFFTFAVFPVMSRQAAQDRAALLRSYRLSVKLLVVVALPAAVICTLTARGLVGVLSGPAFLPDGAIALQLVIWSIPIGWINSLTNYVLIALNRQRHVAVASAVGLAFNLTANALLIPRYSYAASAVVTILSEAVLLGAFYILLRRDLRPVGWVQVLGRPALAGLTMAAAAWAVAPFNRPLAVMAGLGIYLTGLVLLRVLTPEELGMLTPLIPWKRRERSVPTPR